MCVYVHCMPAFAYGMHLSECRILQRPETSDPSGAGVTGIVSYKVGADN